VSKYLFSILVLGFGVQAMACNYTTVTGVDYGGAAYNCEAILQGQTQNCHPSGNMWICQCAYSCGNGGGNGPGTHYTVTTGPDYGSASYNCEAILQGQTANCHPDGRMWVCGCYY
jgi:hypothetical protein